MDETYERFSYLIKEKGLKVADICKMAGVSSATMTDWKKGRYKPKADKIKKIADALHVSVDYLLTGSEKEKPGIILDAEQEKVLEMFRNATPEVRQIVLAVLKTGTQQP